MPVNKDLFILQAEKTGWEPGYGGEVRYLRKANQGGATVSDTGIWRRNDGGPSPLPPGKVTYELAETVYVIKGRVTIEDDSGKKFNLKAGDGMSFDKGCTAYWTIETDEYEEFFVYS